MSPQLKKLLETLTTFDNHNHDLVDLSAVLQKLPEPGELPHPWATWTLIGLARHQTRQRWVAEIVEERLNGDITKLASYGSLGHPESQSGTVPGMPQWEYYFHGGGCCIQHKVNGDAVDVDFYDDSADYFDIFFYQRYIDSLRTPKAPEQRLRQLFPTTRSIQIAIDILKKDGALTPYPERDRPVRLSDQVQSHADSIAAFCDAWNEPKRKLFLSAIIGDWIAAKEFLAGNPNLSSLAPIVAKRADACRDLWGQHVITLVASEEGSSDAIHALGDLRPKNFDQYLISVLHGPPSGKTSAALNVIEKMDDANWCDHVYSFLQRTSPTQPNPAPYNWMTALKFLIRHEYMIDEVIGQLTKARGTEIGEAVLLSLEHAPHLVLPLVRRALLSDIPMSRTTVAATLALIDAPWSRQELIGALALSNDQQKTADIRAALMELRDTESAQAVLDWEQRNPHEKEMGTYIEVDGRKLGPFYSFDEHALENRQSRIAYEMQKIHDRVMKVRNVNPASTSTRRWWPFWRKR